MKFQKISEHKWEEIRSLASTEEHVSVCSPFSAYQNKDPAHCWAILSKLLLAYFTMDQSLCHQSKLMPGRLGCTFGADPAPMRQGRDLHQTCVIVLLLTAPQGCIPVLSPSAKVRARWLGGSQKWQGHWEDSVGSRLIDSGVSNTSLGHVLSAASQRWARTSRTGVCRLQGSVGLKGNLSGIAKQYSGMLGHDSFLLK